MTWVLLQILFLCCGMWVQLKFNFSSVVQNNLDELFMLMHFLDAGKVSSSSKSVPQCRIDH
jgi:hypothetical protein